MEGSSARHGAGETRDALYQGRADDGPWIFCVGLAGHRYVYHDGDQGGFSSEMLIDPRGAHGQHSGGQYNRYRSACALRRAASPIEHRA